MFSLRAVRPCSRTVLSRAALQHLRPPPSRAIPRVFAKCGSSALEQRVHRLGTATSRPPRPVNVYPEVLNVFHSGPVPTVTLGLVRLCTIGVAIYGFTFGLYGAITDAEAPLWAPPAIVAIALMTLILPAAAFGGYINAINIHLPPVARRSKEHLMSFAEHIPSETRMQIKSMWFRPWPSTKFVYFGDLRRLHANRYRLTNLEHIPLEMEKQHQESGWRGWIVRVFMGRYWASRTQIKDRSRAPGAWDKMWEQIPFVGEEVKIVGKRQHIIKRKPGIAPVRAMKNPR